MQKAPPTPKGFRDIKPDVAKKRRRIINVIVEVLEKQGFTPIETPTIEFAQNLTGKYGEEERLIYKFTDRGGRDLALRYDLTVPLARYVATYQHEIKFPFRRYQTGQVFRGENPQHGRYREFTQFDFDTVGPPRLASGKAGSADLEEDAKIIAAALNSVKKIGLKNAIMLINDRKNFKGLSIDVVRALDKINKIKEKGFLKELNKKGFSNQQANTILQSMINKNPSKDLIGVFKHLDYYGVKKQDYKFDPLLARGLDYYTGPIFELKPNHDPRSLTIGSGGRYDNLIGMFMSQKRGLPVSNQVPATGFSFGLDRLVELL